MSTRRRVVQLMAAAATVTFLVVAVPYIALTTMYALAGVPIAANTLLVMLLYSILFIALAIFWVRQFTARSGGMTGRGLRAKDVRK